MHHPFLNKDRVPKGNNKTYHNHSLWFPAKPLKQEQDTVGDEEMVECGFYLEDG